MELIQINPEPMWMCDGCRIQKPERQSQDPCGCSKHWGWVKVGSDAYRDLMDRGIHPMTTLMTMVQNVS